MKLICLHDNLNPQKKVPMDAEDFSVAYPFGSGSAVRLKSADQPITVSETPDQVFDIISAVLNS